VEHFRTLTGLTVEAARAKLDEELPRNAYKRIPGGADLTDINPGYMRKTLNDIFGICGVGWGYSYSPSDLHISYDGSGQKAVSATLLHLVFWYKLTDGESVLTLEIPATGGSENRNASFAMKGALTNAIGNAASNVGFQESVYMDLRSHATVGRKPAQATSRAGGNNRGNGSNGTGGGVSIPPVSEETTARARAVEIDFGKHSGLTLGAILDEDPDYVTGYLAQRGQDEKVKAAALYLAQLEPPSGNGKNGNGRSALTLEEALAVTMPFGTRDNPGFKGQTLGHIEGIAPDMLDWLAEKARSPKLRQAAEVVVAAR
jgi:hypothetical protein